MSRCAARRLAVSVALLASACTAPREEADTRSDRAPAAQAPDRGNIPSADPTGMEPRVIARLQEARDQVATNPADAEAWGRYGIVFDAHEFYDLAAETYLAAHRLKPESFRWPYLLARVTELSGGDTEDVVSIYEDAAELRPTYAPLWVRLGDVQVRRGDTEAAQASYTRAVELDPQLAKAHRGLGQTLLAQGDDRALGYLLRATELLPEDGAAWASLARAQALAGDRTKARRAAARSRELDQIHTSPDPVLLEVGRAGISSQVCFRRARELMDQGRYREAISDLSIAAESLGDSPDVHLRLGRCYLEIGRTDAALTSFRTALELRDELPDVHAQVGTILVGRGRLDEALAHYRRSLELEPVNAKTLALLASAVAQAGDPETALRHYEAADRAGDLDAPDHNNWGSTLARTGRMDEALLQFEEAVRLDPDFVNARFNLGAALEQLGRVDEAILQYREAVALDPRHRAATRLQALESR